MPELNLKSPHQSSPAVSHHRGLNCIQYICHIRRNLEC